jgi:ferrous iron transport protein B
MDLGGIGYLCGYAYVISLIVYQTGRLFAGGSFGVGSIFGLAALAGLIYLLARRNRYDESEGNVSERKVSADV